MPRATRQIRGPFAKPVADLSAPSLEPPEADWPAGRWRWAIHGLAAGLIALYFSLAVTAADRQSATYDEPAHLVAGYSYWKTPDIRLQPANGILPQRWAALPLLWKDIKFPSLQSPDWHASNDLEMGRQFLYKSGNDARQMLRLGRRMIALLGAAMGVIVYCWPLRLFGPPGGLLSVLLFSVSPTLLAHGALVTSDMAAALFFLAAIGAWARVLQRLTPGRLAASCLASAALFLAKFSAPLLIPMVVVLMAIRFTPAGVTNISRRPGGNPLRPIRLLRNMVALGIVHFVMIWAAIWIAYDCRYAAFARPGPDDRLSPGWQWALAEPDLTTSIVAFARSAACCQRPISLDLPIRGNCR